jgi:PPIC-type PPIASE domain
MLARGTVWGRIARRAALGGLALAAVAGSGCGSTPRPVVVHVGSVAIERSTVDRWAKAIGLGGAGTASLEGAGGTPREKALGALISANWLIAEATRQGLAPSDHAVDHELDERIELTANGKHEFESELASTGQTLDDVRLEIRAALAAAKLRESLSRHVPAVTQSEIASYYRRNLASFRNPDRREVDLIEALPSRAAAVALGRRLGAGARFTKRAIRELVARQTPSEAAHLGNHLLVQAIFATPPGKIGGPVSFDQLWVILVVRKVVPSSIKPLTEVKAEISKRLSDERRRLALASFIDSYRKRWTARTSCSPGFVVQKCSQYRGPLKSEGNPLLGV